ncbi:MAG: PEP-CTERM sorting domain-containing protein [Sphingobium sp.]|nr:PEP-CTERM sorting domain-containing protein [Sphingobium sp.]
MKTALSAIAILAAATLPAAANADIININGAITGCTTCNGVHPVAGDTVGDFISPVLVTFGPGTYTVTNGVGQQGAAYDVWNFNTGNPYNWIWSFIIADAATHKVVLDSLPDPNAFTGLHDDVANAAYALNYSGTFTLASTTQLAFFTEDYYPPDNAGGVSLNVSLKSVNGAVPEPASWALMICGLGFAGAAMRASGSKRALRIV